MSGFFSKLFGGNQAGNSGASGSAGGDAVSMVQETVAGIVEHAVGNCGRGRRVQALACCDQLCGRALKADVGRLAGAGTPIVQQETVKAKCRDQILSRRGR